MANFSDSTVRPPTTNNDDDGVGGAGESGKIVLFCLMSGFVQYSLIDSENTVFIFCAPTNHNFLCKM